jgi:2-polyprenyl-6-methoxyphenol hydroxylase-like FAD-dependent oxidoreductase
MTRVSKIAGPSVLLLGDAAHPVTPSIGQGKPATG